jgi:hypothetical protein
MALIPGLFPYIASKHRPQQWSAAWMESAPKNQHKAHCTEKHDKYAQSTLFLCTLLVLPKHDAHVPLAGVSAGLKHTRGKVQLGNVCACHTVVCVRGWQTSYQGVQKAQQEGKNVHLACPDGAWCATLHLIYHLFPRRCNSEYRAVAHWVLIRGHCRLSHQRLPSR